MSCSDNVSYISFQVIRGPIGDDEWARFQHYANLVRSFKTGSERIDGIISATLLVKTQGQPLFPRLTTLHWNMGDQSSSSFLLFMSPMLRDVMIGFHGDGIMEPPQQEPDADEYTSVAALQLVHAVAPHLERVQVTCGHTYVAQFLTQFTNLRSVNLHAVKDHAAVYIVCQTLPLLQRLDVFYSRVLEDERPSLPAHLPDLHLGAITTLKLSGDTEMTTLTLEAIQTHRLRSIVIKIEFLDDLCARCIHAVATRLAGSLHTLKVEFHDHYTGMQPRVFHDLVAPLYAVRTLRQVLFGVCFETPVVVTAKDLANIAQAWPDLERLRLPYSRSLDEDEGVVAQPVPIMALEHLAKGCPRLWMLVMQMPDATPLEGMNLDAIPTYPNLLRRAHLMAGEWEEEDFERAIDYLQCIFPRLEEDQILTDMDFQDM